MAGWESDIGRHPRVDELVLEVLSDSSGTLAFNGLRRALKVHPESLIRALRRLERDGVVQRSGAGYSLREPAPPLERELPTRTVASVGLPMGTPESDVMGRLAGRWLGPLRWLGIYERPGDPWLVWTIGSSRTRAILSVRRSQLRVLTDAPASDRAAVDASYALLARALDAVREVGAFSGSDPELARLSEGRLDPIPN